MAAVVFVITAVLVLTGGVGVIASRRPVHSALALLLVLLSLAADYLLLDAQFIAMLQVIVYAGAIVVLFVFIIMLLNAQGGGERSEGARIPWSLVAVLALPFCSGLLAAVAGIAMPAGQVPVNFGTIQMVGRALFTRYVLAFEAASLILLIGMIGAVALGKRPRASMEGRR